MALSAFAIAVVAGLAAGNPARTVLFHALVAMIVCQALGLIAGSVAERAVARHIASCRDERPPPECAAPARATQKKLDLG